MRQPKRAASTPTKETEYHSCWDEISPPCPVLTAERQTRLEAKELEKPVKAYKLGKDRSSYCVFEVCLHQIGTDRMIPIGEVHSIVDEDLDPQSKEFTCSFEVHLQNGSCCLVRFMLVYDEPTAHFTQGFTQQLCGLVDPCRVPIDFKAPRVAPCLAVPDKNVVPERVYSWPGCSRINCYKHRANPKNCKGSTCKPIQRLGKASKTVQEKVKGKLLLADVTDGSQQEQGASSNDEECETKSIKHFHISIDEAGSHVHRKYFRFVMAVYEWESQELIGVNISKQFQAVANNDVSEGPPFTQLALDVKSSWAGFNAPDLPEGSPLFSNPSRKAKKSKARSKAGKRKRRRGDSDSESESEDQEESGSPGAGAGSERPYSLERRRSKRACTQQRPYTLTEQEPAQEAPPDMPDASAIINLPPLPPSAMPAWSQWGSSAPGWSWPTAGQADLLQQADDTSLAVLHGGYAPEQQQQQQWMTHQYQRPATVLPAAQHGTGWPSPGSGSDDPTAIPCHANVAFPHDAQDVLGTLPAAMPIPEFPDLMPDPADAACSLSLTPLKSLAFTNSEMAKMSEMLDPAAPTASPTDAQYNYSCPVSQGPISSAQAGGALDGQQPPALSPASNLASATAEQQQHAAPVSTVQPLNAAAELQAAWPLPYLAGDLGMAGQQDVPAGALQGFELDEDALPDLCISLGRQDSLGATLLNVPEMPDFNDIAYLF